MSICLFSAFWGIESRRKFWEHVADTPQICPILSNGVSNEQVIWLLLRRGLSIETLKCETSIRVLPASFSSGLDGENEGKFAHARKELTPRQ